jgi:DegV family protein with EDD domain
LTVFDSRQLSLGTGFMVETAARMAQAGCSAGEITDALNDQNKRTYVAAALDTLEYLRRSGRVSSIASSIGNLLHIKPILKMYDGRASNDRVRTRNHAVKHLLTLLQEHVPYEKLAFLHSGALEQAQALHKEAKELAPGGEIWFEHINPVLGAHIGPGVFGFAGVSKR